VMAGFVGNFGTQRGREDHNNPCEGVHSRTLSGRSEAIDRNTHRGRAEVRQSCHIDRMTAEATWRRVK